MSFHLSSSKCHIDIDESDIIDIHRSVQPVTPADPMYNGHPCEAYVCTGREKGLLLAYVAIQDTITGSRFIFTASCDGKDTGACRQLAAEADELVAAMGFFLEKVNIDYGAAMRQVIIRSLRIMRPTDRNRVAPLPRKPVPAEEQRAEPALNGAGETGRHAPRVPSPPQLAPLVSGTPDASPSSQELSALQASLERLGREKSEAEAAAGQAIAELMAQVEQARAACRRLEESREDDLDRYRRSDDSRAQEIETLRAELAVAIEARQAAEDALGREAVRHQEGQARATDMIARLEAAVEEAGIRLAALDARLLVAAADLHTAESALEAESRRRSEGEAAARKRERLLRKELAALRKEEGATRAQFQELEEQCRLHREERDAALARLSEAADTLRPGQGAGQAVHTEELRRLKEESQQLAARLEEVTRGHSQALQDKQGELQHANGTMERLVADLERLTSEQRASDQVVGTFKKKVRYAVDRLRKEKKEIEEELQRLREKVAETSLPPGNVVPAISRSLTVAEADAESPRLSAGPAGGAVFGKAGSSFTSGDTVFRHDPTLTTISCHSADEIVELHGSINAIQAGPFGRTPQVCRAHILVLKPGRARMLYLVWFLTADREVLVCTPERQPDTAAGYADMIRDAIFYFESTGFMMDRCDLSKPSPGLFTTLEQSGVCRFEAAQAPVASTG